MRWGRHWNTIRRHNRNNYFDQRTGELHYNAVGLLLFGGFRDVDSYETVSLITYYGASPAAGLVFDFLGSLYGTTYYGGTNKATASRCTFSPVAMKLLV